MLNENQKLKSFFMTQTNLKFRHSSRRGQRAGQVKQELHQNEFQRYPIIVNDYPANNPFTVPSARQLMTYPSYNTFPTISYYGNYPYQYYQQYPQNPEEPTFILVSPKAKNKKTSKPKVASTRPPPIKFTDGRQRPTATRKQALKMDIKLVKAVQQPSSKFVIEKFIFIPGKRIAQLSTSNSVPTQSSIVSTTVKTPAKNVELASKSQKLQIQKPIFEQLEPETATVKVESVGMSSADQLIPDYSSFFPRSVFSQPGNGDEATLILEPNAKAVSGNDGTSISAPISRAILRRGTAVKVLFRPQSFAITGANGVAHAQADLILDFIDDE